MGYIVPVQCSRKAIGPSDITDNFSKCHDFEQIIRHCLNISKLFHEYLNWNVWWFAANHQTYCLMIQKNFLWTLLVCMFFFVCFFVLSWSTEMMWTAGSWIVMKMSNQYRKSHYGDKTILWPSYLHNGISYTGKTSLYWIKTLFAGNRTQLK